jgi:hypothetical protein
MWDLHIVNTSLACTRFVCLGGAGNRRYRWFALFAPLEAVDTIVTDAISPEDRARLEENGIDVLAVG